MKIDDFIQSLIAYYGQYENKMVRFVLKKGLEKMNGYLPDDFLRYIYDNHHIWKKAPDIASIIDLKMGYEKDTGKLLSGKNMIFATAPYENEVVLTNKDYEETDKLLIENGGLKGMMMQCVEKKHVSPKIQ